MFRQKRTTNVCKKVLDKWSQIYWQFVLDNEDKNLDWTEISYNPNITWDIIQDHPDKPWKWKMISCNPNITWDIIKNNPDKDWCGYMISYNPNITMDIIQNNPDEDWDWEWEWGWMSISENEFTIQKTDFIVKEYHKHLMAFRIQYMWKNALVNPNCQLGIRKIERDMIYAGL